MRCSSIVSRLVYQASLIQLDGESPIVETRMVFEPHVVMDTGSSIVSTSMALVTSTENGATQDRIRT